MPSELQIVHRTGVDGLAKIVQHANSPACPRGMLELNPAFGCQFQCAYCGIYAMEREYFDQVIVYDDFPEYLDGWLREHADDIAHQYFYFSAKTDCLQPALVESGITLAILEVLRKHNARYFLVTKGGLPPPDIRAALIRAKDINQIILSIPVPNEELRELLEPAAATIADRLALAEFCAKNGIFASASCCPILPLGDPTYLTDIFVRLAAAGVRHFYFDFARLSRQAVLNMVEILPDSRGDFEHLYFAQQARVSRWHMPHRRLTIDKFQPPLSHMLAAFERLAERVEEVVPGATVSVCNHFATPQTLPRFNDRSRAECISCMGQRFA